MAPMLPTAQRGTAEHIPDPSLGPVLPIIHTASPLTPSAHGQEHAHNLIHEHGQVRLGPGGRVLQPHPPACCSPEAWPAFTFILQVSLFAFMSAAVMSNPKMNELSAHPLFVQCAVPILFQKNHSAVVPRTFLYHGPQDLTSNMRPARALHSACSRLISHGQQPCQAEFPSTLHQGRKCCQEGLESKAAAG